MTPDTPAPAAKEPPLEVLTAPGGPFPLLPQLAEKCAVVRVGPEYRLYVHFPDTNNLDVLSIKRQTEIHFSTEITHVEPCELRVLRDFYGHEAVKSLGDSATETRRKVIELLDRIAEIGASDFQLWKRGDRALGHVQHDGYLSDPIIELTGPNADNFRISTFYYGDDGAAVPQENVDQPFSITEPGKLPRDIQAIRGQTATMTDGWWLNLRFIKKTSQFAKTGLEGLGLLPEHLDDLYYVQNVPSGLVTVTGPTESGKSTLINLYCIDYSEANHNRVTIIGLDDTPEFMAPEIKQLHVPERTADGPDPYALKMHTSLRLAPHAIKLGECRTGEAANAAIDAVNVSKLVLTTLHQKEGLLIPLRYERLGVPRHVAYDDQNHICWIAVRLVPTLCDGCKIKADEAAAKVDRRRLPTIRAFQRVLKNHAGQYHVRGDGCPQCHRPDLGSIPGLKGRQFCAEVIIPNKQLCTLLKDDYHAARRYLVSVMGKSTLRLHGLTHMQSGKIGFDEYSKFIAHPQELADDLSYVADRINMQAPASIETE
ncbi:MAG: ATPase, T2SS/T4P/T4SS family [Magnetospirillum sp.]|nr:ATPase, T2SS/T4P/T4SS family [Magnetospirillum sp.]